MQSSLLSQLFSKTADVYYYGDHITGDMLLTQCVALFSKLYEVQSKQDQVMEILADINTARRANDFTAIADMLRYQIPPLIQESV
ncbi:hypothetical protein [Enterovibrio nigricans]|uniref:Uncharacterized protein n=1 Tax=Enterovibrio nigricans DSM 22720 TaxID=1121868 RepID=A0A1T4UKN8_9GAMM|nr:hypothetical protein [Enterovibrio nigricans]PKF51187.1 hypothetical protein AT251_05705 [Enterovibrio nigricans]SKA53031.1 hypothetical protein SAMN02745132_01904 [Enterovibrio nigricans DSM 22720]